MFVGIGVGIGRNRFAQGIFNAYNLRVVADGGITEAGQCVDAVTGILLNASLLLIPSGYKGGKLYAEIPTNGNGDLTWTRASDAWRTNANGLIQRVPWNLASYSEEFTNAAWAKTRSSITANTTNAPNGTLTADKLVENTATGSHNTTQSVVPASTGFYTFSSYIKKSERNWVLFTVFTGAGDCLVWFNVDNGTVGTIVNAAGSASTTATITNVGDGWYRCAVTINKTSTNTGIIGIFLATNDYVISYTGDGTSGLFIWGAQLVEGTTAQTYLPTTDRLNFPRLSYMYGSCPSALLEPQRTNLYTYSEQFDNAAWTKNNATITANTTTSPDGTTNADTITDNTTVGLHQVQQTISATVGTYTLSCYAKAGTLSYVGLYNNSANAGKFFNLSNGTTASNIVNAPTTATIQSVGNGWYRCTITTNTLVASSNWQILISEDGSNFNYIGTGKNAFIYGAQLEAGAYPTTYIPTTTATATRVADSFSRSNIYTNGLISASGGTWFVELRGNESRTLTTEDVGAGLELGNSSGTSTDAFKFRRGGGTQRINIWKVVSGTSTSIYNIITDSSKIAIKWNGTTADVFVNGTKVVSATSFTATNMDFLRYIQNQFPTFIQQMALFPTPLSDTDCATLTT